MLNFVKVIAVVTKFKIKGVKPTIHRTAKTTLAARAALGRCGMTLARRSRASEEAKP